MEEIKSGSLYHVFSQVLRLHYHRTRSLLEKIGVYPGQPPMLIALSHQDGLSQKELAEKLNIKPATITVMITRMKKADLVERRQDPNDQRVQRVYLTERGKEIAGEVWKILITINEDIFRDFTEEEKALLRRLFMQMKENLASVCEDKCEF